MMQFPRQRKTNQFWRNWKPTKSFTHEFQKIQEFGKNSTEIIKTLDHIFSPIRYVKNLHSQFLCKEFAELTRVIPLKIQENQNIFKSIITQATRI